MIRSVTYIVHNSPNYGDRVITVTDPHTISALAAHIDFDRIVTPLYIKSLDITVIEIVRAE